MKVKSLSHVQLFVTPWTVAYHAPPSMGFSRQGYWSGLPFPSPGIFPTQGLNPGLPHWRQTLPSEPPGKPRYYIYIYVFHMCVHVCQVASVISNSVQPCKLYPARPLCPWDSPGKNTGVVAMPSSRGSSWPMDPTLISYVSCTGRGFLYY